MTLYAGLLCAAGLSEGCLEVQRAQDATTGQWARSPNKVGCEPGAPLPGGMPGSCDENPFSGDMLAGVAAWAVTQGDKAKPQIAKWLNFIVSNKVAVPSEDLKLDIGYKTCHSPGDTCLVGPNEAFLLSLVANKMNLAANLPQEIRDPATKYGFTLDSLMWQAGMMPRGFVPHLTGVDVLVARLAGLSDPRLDAIAAILAKRERHNPFFLYLLLGPDQLVLDEADAKCQDPQLAKDYGEWIWMRADTELQPNGQPKWKRSMKWDCAFIYSLLSK
jgi:hypothetical protein